MKKTLASPEDAAEIVSRLHTLTGEEQPRWGRMNVAEMVCHLREAYRAVADARPLTPGMTFPMPPERVKWMALELEREWRPGARAALELEPGQPGVVPAEFSSDRYSAIVAMQHFRVAESRATEHPYFGAMTAEDWLRWGYLHADHHLRQFGR